MGFGTPSVGNNVKSAPRRQKEPTLVVRILPPILSCAAQGQWYNSFAQHFGYSVPSSKGDGKQFLKTFMCIEKVHFENRQKVIDQVCPECALIEERKEALETAKRKLKAAGKSEEEIRNLTKTMVEWLSRHNRDFKFYVNVKDQAGEFYTLAIGSKAFKQIQKIRDDYRKRAKSIDIVQADQGIWLEIQKTGKGFSTEYTVSVVEEEVIVGGETFKKTKLAPLTEDDYEKACVKCWDLSDVGIRVLSPDKVKMLVESGGDPETVESIFNSSDRRPVSKPVETATPAAEEEFFGGEEFENPDGDARRAPDPTPLAEAPLALAEPEPAVEEEDEVELAMRVLKAAQEAKAKKAAAAAKPVAKPAPAKVEVKAAPVANVSEYSEEDFLKQFA